MIDSLNTMKNDINRKIPEFSVTDLSLAIKNTVESAFGQITVKGEISRIFLAQSGHAYITLKDETSVLESICFRNTFAGLKITPEAGMEVVCFGKLSIFSKKSQYQLVVSSIRPAGSGALMEMLEARKKKLASKGYFDDSRKKTLPFLPEVIGIVTSLKGAVIKDILHRFRDRFPRKVYVWPTLVQGDEASGQIVKAINGFNSITLDSDVQKPDIIIIARGGGSVEDLWCFNEEEIIFAVAQSTIPIISAIGHETDFTLIDLASDYRAPTPTAAAEIAVPVRIDLVERINTIAHRLSSGLVRKLRESESSLNASRRGLKDPKDVINHASQRLDYIFSSISSNLEWAISENHQRVRSQALKSNTLKIIFASKRLQLNNTINILSKQIKLFSDEKENSYKFINSRIQIDLIRRYINQYKERLTHKANLLKSLSYEKILERGFALVREKNRKKTINRSLDLNVNQSIIIEFFDGSVNATVNESNGKHAEKKLYKSKKNNKKNYDQGDLF